MNVVFVKPVWISGVSITLAWCPALDFQSF